jgi:hypothetical protein
LDCALNSNDVLRTAIINGKLFAFADDIVLIFKSKIELQWQIEAMQKLKDVFLLKLHPKKS